MKTSTKAPTTYTVMSRRTGSREYRKMAFGFLKQAAVCEVYTLFTSSHSIAQAAIVNEKTGKVVRVRGLLCFACNTAIGQAKDDPALLRRMADYVERGS